MRRMLFFVLIVALFFVMDSSLLAQQQGDFFWLPAEVFSQSKSHRKLKRIFFRADKSLNNLNDTSCRDEYMYENNRLSKVTHIWANEISSYDVYEYNKRNELIKKTCFHANKKAPTGFLNIYTYVYEYKNGKVYKETVHHPEINNYEYVIYKYDGNNLIAKESFNGKQDKLESSVFFKYDDFGQCTWARLSSGRYAIHLYSEGLVKSSHIYNSDGTALRKITYTYDKSGDLILSEPIELWILSSYRGMIAEYEYFSD